MERKTCDRKTEWYTLTSVILYLQLKNCTHLCVVWHHWAVPYFTGCVRVPDTSMEQKAFCKSRHVLSKPGHTACIYHRVSRCLPLLSLPRTGSGKISSDRNDCVTRSYVQPGSEKTTAAGGWGGGVTELQASGTCTRLAEAPGSPTTLVDLYSYGSIGLQCTICTRRPHPGIKARKHKPTSVC